MKFPRLNFQYKEGNLYVNLLLLIFYVLLCSFQAHAADTEHGHIEIDNNLYSVEIARSNTSLRRGLMFRQNLAARHGMLFIFPTIKRHGIWMKNVYLPLKVIWMNEHFQIIDIQDLKPCITDYCPIFYPPAPSKYVLELNIDALVTKKSQVMLK